MAAHPPYAGIVSRVSAIAVDTVVLTVAVSAVAAGLPAVWTQVIGVPPRWLTDGAQWVGGVLPVAYFTACWSISGRTLGGLLMGTRLVRPGGGRLGPVRAFLRAFFGLLIVPLWVIGLIGVLWTDRRQSLLDKVFGTVVRFTGH